MRWYLLAGIVFTAAALGGGWLIFGNRIQPEGAGDKDLRELAAISRGEVLYQTNCAACHGANLEGQPDWQTPDADGRLPPPPHDKSGHTWHHSDGLLFNYTRLGGKAALAAQGIPFNSGMPGFSDVLKDREIRDILSFIKSTWPERERELQATRTEAERLQKEVNQ